MLEQQMFLSYSTPIHLYKNVPYFELKILKLIEKSYRLEELAYLGLLLLTKNKTI